MSADETYPSAANVVLFKDAYDLHIAATTTFRTANTPAERLGLPPDAYAQRVAILQIAAKLIIAERNKLLDEFCTSWLRYRNLPLPPPEPHATTET